MSIQMSHTGHIPVVKIMFQFHGITVNQVKVLIQKLVNGRSTGIHNIANKTLTLADPRYLVPTPGNKGGGGLSLVGVTPLSDPWEVQ